MEKIFLKNFPFARYFPISNKPHEIKIRSLQEIEQGAINALFLYEVEVKFGQKKIRIDLCCKKYGQFFKKMPNIKFSRLMRDRGIYECVFIEKFKSLVRNIGYCQFPNAIFYDHSYDLLAMEKVEGVEATNFENMPISLESLSEKLGKIIGTYQRKTYGLVDIWYRPFLRYGKLRYYCPTWNQIVSEKMAISRAVQSFAEATISAKSSISHTDVSLKNVFVSSRGGITIIDFEHSNYDDPAEDVSHWLYYFFISNIVEKLDSSRTRRIISEFLRAYRKEVTKSSTLSADLPEIERRISKNIALLLMYRIDTSHMSQLEVPEGAKKLLYKYCLMPFEKDFMHPEEYLESILLDLR
jgi:tRNA A-37 threonylcarbamoyl transferase component Bud32